MITKEQKRGRKMKKKLVGIVVGILSILFISNIGMKSVDADTGEQVLVSLSYLDAELTKLRNEMNEKIKELARNKEQGTGEALGFVVEELEPGQRLIAKGGTELILRGGQAVAVLEGANGLNNITTGKDLQNGESLGLNQLIIVPRDERGIRATNKAWVMVRGRYEIRK